MQNYGWILGVLTDLSTFAEKNGLTSLGQHIEETRRIAEKEILPFQGCADLEELHPSNDR
jgi:hypothetical protein